jgi:hypothetical protein
MSNELQKVSVAIKKDFSGFAAWVKDEFDPTFLKADQIAIAITEDAKAALTNGSALDLANIIQGVFPSVHGLPTAIVQGLQKGIPKTLAFELGLQLDLTDPTPATIQASVAQILGAFKLTAAKDKLYSTLAAQVTTIIQADTTRTFGSRVKDIENILAFLAQDETA